MFAQTTVVGFGINACITDPKTQNGLAFCSLQSRRSTPQQKTRWMATIPHPQRPQQRAALGAVEALLASARLAMRRRLMAVPSVQPRHSGRLQAAVAAHLGAAPEPLPQPSAAAVLAAAAELLHQPSAAGPSAVAAELLRLPSEAVLLRLPSAGSTQVLQVRRPLCAGAAPKGADLGALKAKPVTAPHMQLRRTRGRQEAVVVALEAPAVGGMMRARAGAGVPQGCENAAHPAAHSHRFLANHQRLLPRQRGVLPRTSTISA